MKTFSTRARAGAIVLAGAAMVGGLVAGAVPAGAAAKSSSPAPAAASQLQNRAASSAVTPASSQLQTLASLDGKCQVGDICLYYLDSAGGYGSEFDTGHNDGNLFNNHFISAGLGKHSTVGNNAEAVWNRDPHTTVYVCTGLNSTGSCGFVGPNVLGNLTSTFRNLSQSITWADSVN